MQSPAYFAVIGLLGGVVGFRLGWRSGRAWLLPLLQGALGFVAFVSAWRGGGPIHGVWAVLGWALGTSSVALLAFRSAPERIDECVYRARPYREEMSDWLRTGRGPETRPIATARRHLFELAAYLAAALATANFLSLVMGAVLLNYMNAYVARLLAAATRPWTVRLLAWNSWSVVRVVAYVLLGVACAAPLAGWFGYPADLAEVRRLLQLGGIGVVADLLLKLLLSRPCGRLLSAAVDLEGETR